MKNLQDIFLPAPLVAELNERRRHDLMGAINAKWREIYDNEYSLAQIEKSATGMYRLSIMWDDYNYLMDVVMSYDIAVVKDYLKFPLKDTPFFGGIHNN